MDILSSDNLLLRELSHPIGTIDDEIISLAKEMSKIMYKNSGIGLAAPQIGVLKRIVVVDVEWFWENNVGSFKILINPNIIWKSNKEQSIMLEGCLSFPEVVRNIKRPENIMVSYLGLDGKSNNRHFDGLWARCIQHEIDHLNGVLLTDYSEDPH